jgi:hypothetical protein
MNRRVIVALFSILAGPAAYAQGSSGVGGGGDAKTEARIFVIRADLLKWIGEGGAKGLKLRKSLTHRLYESAMKPLLQPHRVIVTALKSSEEDANDPEKNTLVLGQPKTCKGFRSKWDRLLHIICNVERFTALSEAEQYVQIHHEFAGLTKIGIEKNRGASSDYSVSIQITDFLVPEQVLKLAVKKREDSEEFDRSSDPTVAFKCYPKRLPGGVEVRRCVGYRVTNPNEVRLVSIADRADGQVNHPLFVLGPVVMPGIIDYVKDSPDKESVARICRTLGYRDWNFEEVHGVGINAILRNRYLLPNLWRLSPFWVMNQIANGGMGLPARIDCKN